MDRWFRKLAPVIALGLALGSVAAPIALAHRGKGHGKKALGTIASFDGTTLTVTLTDGSTAMATATEDTRVKVEHRGHHGKGKSHRKPSNGSLEDLAAGNLVLRMKVDECGELDKIRIRRSADAGDHHTPAPEPSTTAEPTPEPTETPTPEPSASAEPTPEPTETNSENDDTCTAEPEDAEDSGSEGSDSEGGTEGAAA